MRSNKSKDTKPELLVRRRLWKAGLKGYRLHWHIPGKPDVAWPGKKVALFINGCFWHRCPTCNLPVPKNNRSFWEEKFRNNVERDKRNLEQLEADGWMVHVVWECDLKKKNREETFRKLLPMLSRELDKPLIEEDGKVDPERA